jgi:FkbM family methyltransferase
MINTEQQTLPNHNDFKPLHSYSQDGEDMLLRPLLLASTPNYDEYKGFYIDIGAHHPFRYSNTMHFYEQGWRGINIEPTPAANELFNQYRNRDINLNIGIGGKRDKKTLYCYSESSLNSFEKHVAENTNETYDVVGTVEVEIYPLAQTLEEHLPADTTIDFMSIDVAGLDLDLLNSNNWDKYRPRFVLVEDVDSNFSKLDASEVYRFLADHNYEIAGKTLRTLIFKEKSQA